MRNIHIPGISLSAEVYRSMTSRCSGTLCFRRRDRELRLFCYRKDGGGYLLHLSMFFALLSRYLPAVSHILGYIEGLPPCPTDSPTSFLAN